MENAQTIQGAEPKKHKEKKLAGTWILIVLALATTIYIYKNIQIQKTQKQIEKALETQIRHTETIITKAP